MVGGTTVLGHLSVVLSSEFCRGPPEEVFWCWVQKFQRAEEKGGLSLLPHREDGDLLQPSLPELCGTNIVALAGLPITRRDIPVVFKIKDTGLFE